MDELLNKFASIAENPYPRLAQWKKETDKKIIGWFPMRIPEEIIHAAGMLPVPLLGSLEEVTLADPYTYPLLCHLVRTSFDLSLKGELDLLDGVVFPDSCYSVALISDVWKHHKPAGLYHHLILPQNMKSPHAWDYILRQFVGLKTALEELAGREISENSLRQSISIYNHNRSLFHRLYQLRRANPGLFRAREIATIVAASMLMPKEEHSRLLSELLERAQTASPSPDGKVRLILSEYLCHMPELDVLDLVEELGGVVIDDDLYMGRRYFHTLTSGWESMSPMEDLVQRHMGDIPCACVAKMNPTKDSAEYLANLVQEAKAGGVISVAARSCQPLLYDLPTLEKSLSQRAIPNLTLITDFKGVTGQMRVRLQAFLETLRRER